MTPVHPPRLSAKQVRIIRALSDRRTIADAAEHLHMSASALSRGLSGAEAVLGVTLFQRGWSGTDPTALGEIVIAQCQRIHAALDEVNLGAGPSRLATKVRWRHLEALAAVARTGSASAAAAALGVRQPAISQALADLAAYVPERLFTRQRAGLAPTEPARMLAALWDQLEADLAQIPRLLAEASGGLVGRVSVGMLPFSGQDFVLDTFSELTRDHPNLRLIAVPGGYNALIEALRRREIDLIIGILRDPAPLRDLEEELLYLEHFTMIAREGHPVHDAPASLEAMAGLRWTVAPHGTPVRRYFERVFRAAGTVPPAQSCEIFSFANTEQMIAGGDSLALLCYGKDQLRRLRPGLRKVEIDLPEAEVPIGITRVRGLAPTPALDAFVGALKRRIAAAEAEGEAA